MTHRPIADLMQRIGTLANRPTSPAASYLAASPAAAAPEAFPLLDVPYYAGPQQKQVITHVDEDAPSAAPSPDGQQQLKWSDFLADDAAALEAPQVLLGQRQEADAVAGGGGRACGDSSGSATGAGAGGGGDDGAAAAFIDAILDCDKEMGVDQLIAELLADPAYYHGASSSSLEMGWGG